MTIEPTRTPRIFRSGEPPAQEIALNVFELTLSDLFPFNKKQPFYNKHELFEGGVATSPQNAHNLMKQGKIKARRQGVGKGYYVVDYLSLIEYMYPHHFKQLSQALNIFEPKQPQELQFLGIDRKVNS